MIDEEVNVADGLIPGVAELDENEHSYSPITWVDLPTTSNSILRAKASLGWVLKLAVEKREWPDWAVQRYLDAAMQTVVWNELASGGWYAEIPAMPGVWADGASQDEVVVDLAEVAADWVQLKLADADQDFPAFDGLVIG